ncbi:MAG TPA: hypothetical protein VIL06_01845 [Coriobacteriia bacterium]
MFDRLDRVSDRTAYLVAALGLGVSLVAAFMAPQEAQLGAWVRLVIWHGMLKWACIVGIFGMGALAIAYLATGHHRFFEWARALQVALLPLWVAAVLIGLVAARLIWNAWSLTERRMVMSLAYTVVAAVALMLALLLDKRRVAAIGQVVTALAMGIGLAWIELGPPGEDVHPASAVMSSPDVAFKVYAFIMMGGCLLAVLALSVPMRHWLKRAEASA